MKFYGTGAVWGGADNKILCRFIDGTLETDDEQVIKKLLESGYKHDGKPYGDKRVVDNTAPITESFEEVKKVAPNAQKPQVKKVVKR